MKHESSDRVIEIEETITASLDSVWGAWQPTMVSMLGLWRTHALS